MSVTYKDKPKCAINCHCPPCFWSILFGSVRQHRTVTDVGCQGAARSSDGRAEPGSTLANDAGENAGNLGELKAKVGANPADHQSRIDLATSA
jgi:hypothetical protein